MWREMGQHSGAIDAHPSKWMMRELVDQWPAHLLSDKVTHTTVFHYLRQLRRIAECIRKPKDIWITATRLNNSDCRQKTTDIKVFQGITINSESLPPYKRKLSMGILLKYSMHGFLYENAFKTFKANTCLAAVTFYSVYSQSVDRLEATPFFPKFALECRSQLQNSQIWRNLTADPKYIKTLELQSALQPEPHEIMKLQSSAVTNSKTWRTEIHLQKTVDCTSNLTVRKAATNSTIFIHQFIEGALSKHFFEFPLSIQHLPYHTFTIRHITIHFHPRSTNAHQFPVQRSILHILVKGRILLPQPNQLQTRGNDGNLVISVNKT